MELCSGLMDRNTKANGAVIKQMEMGSLFMLMETFTRENGSMIKHRVMELILMLMVQTIKEIG